MIMNARNDGFDGNRSDDANWINYNMKIEENENGNNKVDINCKKHIKIQDPRIRAAVTIKRSVMVTGKIFGMLIATIRTIITVMIILVIKRIRMTRCARKNNNKFQN